MLKLIDFFKKRKFSISSPPQKKIVIYGHGAEQLQFLNKKDYVTYYTSGEEINLFLLLKTFFYYGFSKFKENYRKCFFETVNPKFVITYRCDLKFFYLLKKKLNISKTILIQWGKTMKSYFRHFHNEKNYNNEVDQMYLFGNKTAEIFSRNIKGDAFGIGSITNNRFKFNKNYKKNSLIFISQAKSNRIFPEIEKLIIEILAKYCKKKNLSFSISTRVLSHDIEGKHTYQNILKNHKNWNYYPRKTIRAKGDYEAYKNVMLSEFVVFIDSTLGYEALSRKKKVVALPLGSFDRNWCKINYRVNKKNKDYYVPTRFGYPIKLKKEGKFWLSSFDERKIENKLNYITKVKQKDWNNFLKKIKIDQIVKFDLKNKTLISNLRNIGVPIKKKF